MAIVLGKLSGKAQPVRIDLGEDGVLTVMYARKRYTPALEQKMNRALKDNLPGEMLAAMVERVIDGWDLVESEEAAQARVDELNMDALAEFLAKGNKEADFVPPHRLPQPAPAEPVEEGHPIPPPMYPVPTTRAAIDELPISFLSSIVTEVVKDNRPEEKKSDNSEGSFS